MSGWGAGGGGSGGSGGSGGLAPSKFDDVVIVRDTDGDPTSYQFYFLTVLVGTILVFYDVNKNPVEYKAA